LAGLIDAIFFILMNEAYFLVPTTAQLFSIAPSTTIVMSDSYMYQKTGVEAELGGAPQFRAKQGHR
jgi:hypothetical protein